MHKSSFFEIIRTFSKEELNNFEDFLNSPYHNRIKNVTSLFKLIKKYAPEFTDVNLERESAWTVIFPDKEYNYGIMKNLIHDLSRLSCEFIAFEELKKSRLKMEVLVCDALHGRNASKVLLKKIKTIEAKFNESNLRTTDIIFQDYFFQMSGIYRMKYLTTFKFDPASDFSKDRNLYTENLLYSFLIQFIIEFCHNRYFEKRKNDETNISLILEKYINKNLFIEILEYIRPGSELFHIMQSFFLGYLSISSNTNENYYYDFKKAAEEALPLISKENASVLLKLLAFAVSVFDSVSINVSGEMFSVYSLMIKYGVFTEPSGILTEHIFCLYASYACTFNSPESLDKLLSDYLDKVPEKSTENCFNFAKANSCFINKEYDRSVEYLNKINFNYFAQKYMVKSLIVMNYFEQNSFESFLYTQDSNRHFISNNKNTPSDELIKGAFELFCNFVNRLFRIRVNKDMAEAAFLKKEIIKSLPNKKVWLLEKVSELEANEQ